MEPDQWEQLLRTARELQEWFPEGVAFIGGLATYAHVYADEETRNLWAASHDGDFMITLADLSDLRDIEALSANRRLGKQQFVKNGFEFDVYVETQHDLPVPVEEVIASSVVKCDLRIACSEHLLILKAEALIDRSGSAKGNKDEDDILRILLTIKDPEVENLWRLSDAHIEAIDRCVNSDAPVRLASGNLHQARQIRSRVQTAWKIVRNLARADERDPGNGGTTFDP